MSSPRETECSRPCLPPLYFQSSSLPDNNCPPEILSYCLEFADWGDLARVAAVQRSWQSVMYDAAVDDSSKKWELATALADGTHGLQRNTDMALKLFQELANVAVDPVTQEPTIENNHNTTTASENHLESAAKRMVAHLIWTTNPLEIRTTKTSDATTTGLAWMKAAYDAHHDMEAAHELALVYEHGKYGVSVDVFQAVEWFRTAAEAGHVEAMAELALCYELGLAVEQSDELSLEWNIKAANAGHLTAKYAVGEAFEEARGVPQSDAEACLWYYKAALEGDEDSLSALSRLEDIARIVLPGVGKLLEA